MDDDGGALRALLAASAIFGGLDEALRAGLASAMRRMAVASGQVLMRQGEAGEAFFVVATGQFEVRLRSGGGSDEVIDTIGPGDVVGEMHLVVGGAASATVVATGEAEVFALHRQAFDELCHAAPALLDTLARTVGRRLQRRQMLAVLPAMFGPLDAAALAALERRVTWLTLRSGEALFHKGDHGDAWYVVTSGRLAVVEPAHNGHAERLISEVGRGEGIGEMALLTGQPRSATVYALRDAELARFPVDQVAELVATQPQVTNAMLRGLARRVMQQSDTSHRARVSGLTLTLVPASPGVAMAELARRISAALGRFGSVRQLSGADLREIGLDQEATGRPDSHPAWIRVSAWLDEQSAAHGFLVLVADAASQGWSARAVGQADRVLIVADAKSDPGPGALEQALLPAAPARRVRCLLALLHRDGSQLPRGTARWLDARHVDAHLHIRLDRDDDIERLARGLAGHGVALALSGGGARCCAHVGVVRAMRERSIPIDLVTGTSAGAMLGFLVAAGKSHEEMSQHALRFYRARPFKSYTLPMFSLLRGDRLSRALQEQCGGAQLEDLWLPLVVVSSNLTRRSVELHTRGPAWEALRASSSLPGLVEPQVRDGQLLVDGGLIDNLPVGVARARLAGRVVAVDVTSDLELPMVGHAYPSPWRELLTRLVHRRKNRSSPPNMLEVMMHSLLLASLAHTRAMRLEADLCLRPELAGFSLLALERHREIIEAGYRYAQEHLATFVAEP